MYGIVLDGEPGAGDVPILEVWQRFLELPTPFGVRSRDRLRRRTGLPHAQEPDPIKAHLCQSIQFSVREYHPAARAGPASPTARSARRAC